jgi:hypothetical protein
MPLGAAEITADLENQLKNQLASTALKILWEGMKKDKLLKDSATLADVEKTAAAGKVLSSIREGSFYAYVSGADGKPYLRFALKGSYGASVGRRIRIPDGAKFPYGGPFLPSQLDYLLTSIAEEIVKKETQVSVVDHESQKKQAAFLDAMRQGLNAASQQNFTLAITYFNLAREADPYSSHVLLNLALAYEKAGGQEVSAIPWYLAYMASSPRAANIGLVRKKILELEGRVEQNAKILLSYAERARRVLGENPGGINWAVDLCLVFAQIRTGENDNARLSLERIAAKFRNKVLEEMALEALKKGNLSEAQKTASSLNSSKVYLEMLRQQLKRNRTPEATRMAAQIGPEGYYEISKYLALTGELQAAKEIAGQKIVETAMQYGLPGKAELRDLAYLEIVKNQAIRKDLAGARKTASEIKSGSFAYKADRYIQEVETKKGDRVLSEEEMTFWADLEKHNEKLSGCGEAGSGTSDLIGRTVIKDLQKAFRPSKEEKDPANTVHYLAAGASSLMKYLDIIREHKDYWELRRTGHH